MSQVNLTFRNKTYSIDESVLKNTISNLQSVFECFAGNHAYSLANTWGICSNCNKAHENHEHVLDNNGVCKYCGYECVETSVASSFDTTGDGVAEVYKFTKALPKRFNSDAAINIDAVKDITDENGVYQQAGRDSHYIKYDEISSGTGTMPYAHVYCGDSTQYLYYSFNVPEDGIYELAAHLRIKDQQLRGATYTVNNGTEYEQSIVTTYGWDTEYDALAIRNNDHLQGAYMSGMFVNLHAGVNTLRITSASSVTKTQHFRNLYFIKHANVCNHTLDDTYTCSSCNTEFSLTMDEAEAFGIRLAEGAILPDYYYTTITFNNGAPRESDGFCRVITSNSHKMSIQKITLTSGQAMPAAGSTVTLRGKIGCVNSTVNGSAGQEARIFDAQLL